jgi:hypothetical protein
LNIFTFIGANEFLDEIEHKIEEPNLENNLFSHCSNPIICMCLLYELLGLLTQRFFSLSNKCRNLKEKCMEMATFYIDAVNDEHFLTQMMLEKDYGGRDCLQITVELELLDLI